MADSTSNPRSPSSSSNNNNTSNAGSSSGLANSSSGNNPAGNSNMNNQETFVQKWLGVSTLVLRILLWPLRFTSQLVFPSGDFDGLSAPVTAKAAQQFVTYLRKLASSTIATTSNNGSTTATNALMMTEPWTTNGFAAVQSDVAQTNSVVLIYLHSPLHRQADQFAKTVLLGNTAWSNFIQQPNLISLGVSIHTAQGAHLAQILQTSSYPCLALLQPKHLGGRGGAGSRRQNNNTPPAMNLVFKAEGPILLSLRPETLVQYLNMTLQRHQATLAEQEARRIQREQETELRRQQDEEYQQALLADQERERQLRLEREEEERRLDEERAAELAKQQAEENRLTTAKQSLRDAPASGGTRVRFVLPTGTKIDRRFYNDDTIRSLKSYLILYFAEQTNDPTLQQIKNIGLSTSFPKKTYHELEEQTLEESGLSPQAVLMVQDLDA